jgi:predicted RNA binding protein YcfA (HicA-like mRNA interferase family)
MPKKIRELEGMLARDGFVFHPGKGSHRKWIHPSGVVMVMSGRPGDDAHHYQEKDTVKKLNEARQRSKK